MPLPLLRSLLLLLLGVTCSFGQATLGRVLPSAIEPGKTQIVVLEGTNFKPPIRISTSLNLECRVESVEEKKLTVAITLPEKTQLGPFGLWVSTPDGPSEPFAMVVDDLPSVVDNGDNHAFEKAQTVAWRSAIDGLCDGAVSDFYRVQVDRPQRLALEVLAQRIGSPLDAILRLHNADGKLLAFADDDSIGPDPRLEISLEPGSYWIEIRDNRFAKGGRYRLRIGDFPIAYHAWPLAANPGVTLQVASVGPRQVCPPPWT